MAEETTEETLKTWRDEELIAEAKTLHGLIYITNCYGTKDMLVLELVSRELERRNYEVKEEKRLVITKKGKT